MAATILIVEDEYAVARGVQYALGQEGYEVTVAPSGEEALKIAGELAPDLLVALVGESWLRVVVQPAVGPAPGNVRLAEVGEGGGEAVLDDLVELAMGASRRRAPRSFDARSERPVHDLHRASGPTRGIRQQVQHRIPHRIDLTDPERMRRGVGILCPLRHALRDPVVHR